MLGLKLLGVFLFVAGVIFCINPGLINKINQWGKRMVFNDEGALKHNVKTGLFLMFIGLVIVLINLYFGKDVSLSTILANK
jgi:hypothetical protein